MNKKLFNSALIAVCGLFFCLILSDITGKWAGVASYNGQDVPLTYNFKVDGDKLTGTTQTPFGAAEITDGKIDKDQITFNVELNGTTVTNSGKVYPDSINLKINYQGYEALTTLKRSKQ